MSKSQPQRHFFRLKKIPLSDRRSVLRVYFTYKTKAQFAYTGESQELYCSVLQVLNCLLLLCCMGDNGGEGGTKIRKLISLR